MAQEKMKIAVLASGRGSNFIAIHDAILKGEIDAEIDILISNKPSAGAVDAARKRNIDVEVIESKGLPPGEFDERAVSILKERGIGLVVLAGFMRIVGKTP